MLNRREVLRLATLGVAAATVPLERLAGPAEAPVPAAFAVPLTIPPVLAPRRSVGRTDFYDLTMRAADVEILPGTTTRIWGYEGVFPGPTIRVRSGRAAVLRQRNALDVDTAVHLHGGNVPASSDGHPNDMIAAGGYRDYLYPNRQPAASLWYHDHAHHQESRNTYFGLTGFYLIGDAAEDRLGLPVGRYDVPLLIQDRSFNPDGSFRFPVYAAAGDTLLVNGRVQPFFEVEQRAYRFRLLNGSSLDGLLDLAFDNGMEFVQVASDGGFLAAPHRTTGIPLAPAERVDVVVDFTQLPIGSQVVLRNTNPNFVPQSEIMRFDVTRPGGRSRPVPARLVPVDRLDPRTSTATRSFDLALDEAAGQFTINGRTFDPDRVDVRTRLGSTEIWEITNRDTLYGIPHTFHLHLVRFQVLDRGGVPPGPAESGWKDTVNVNPGETVRIITRFGDFPGRFPYHCHLMGHSTIGMMGQLEIVR